MTATITLPGPEVPVIDESRLLNEFGGAPEILAELRDLFLEHAPVLYDGILAALDRGDAAAVVDQAHSLKGSCATYGASRLAMVCRNIEMAARGGDLATAGELRDAMSVEYEAVFAAIGSIHR
ncbi:MAG TPA: Hpt domain-containing protein [Candidatus Krumholzibacteria bacterium]|nr:Hpt domain-containing protein [Candidatus Krumholzibacteria bacterium]